MCRADRRDEVDESMGTPAVGQYCDRVSQISDPEQAMDTGGSGRSPSLALATLLFVLFLTFLDNTIVTVVLANVQGELHASVSQLQWVVNGYALTFAGLMLSFGTIGDLFGRKKVMLTGVAVFCAGSVIAAVAPTTAILIAGRVVMGVGAAASEPGTLSMIRHLYPGRAERARSLGIWVAVSSLGLALGPLIGGLLVYGWSWRAIFWFNVFFGVLAFTSAIIVLPETSDPVNARFDFLGFFLGALSLGSLTFGIILGETAGYRTWWIDLLFLFALLAAIVFVIAELRAKNPVLDVRYFRRSTFAGSNIIAFTTYFGTFAIFFMVALYLQVVGSNSPLGLALNFIPLAVGMVAASLLTGRWVAAWGPRDTHGHWLPFGGRRHPPHQRKHLPARGNRPDRVDDVHGWSGSRHGPRARHLGGPRLGPSGALGHGCVDYQHLPRARSGGGSRHARIDRQRATYRQPGSATHRHRYPEGVPVARGVGGDNGRLPGRGEGSHSSEPCHRTNRQRGRVGCLRGVRTWPEHFTEYRRRSTSRVVDTRLHDRLRKAHPPGTRQL